MSNLDLQYATSTVLIELVDERLLLLKFIVDTRGFHSFVDGTDKWTYSTRLSVNEDPEHKVIQPLFAPDRVYASWKECMVAVHEQIEDVVTTGNWRQL